MANFIPHETIIFDDPEPPGIYNKVIKRNQQNLSKIYQLYLKKRSNVLATKLETL